MAVNILLGDTMMGVTIPIVVVLCIKKIVKITLMDHSEKNSKIRLNLSTLSLSDLKALRDELKTNYAGVRINELDLVNVEIDKRINKILIFYK
jgi:hypothetical protein